MRNNKIYRYLSLAFIFIISLFTLTSCNDEYRDLIKYSYNNVTIYYTEEALAHTRYKLVIKNDTIYDIKNIQVSINATDIDNPKYPREVVIQRDINIKPGESKEISGSLGFRVNAYSLMITSTGFAYCTFFQSYLGYFSIFIIILLIELLLIIASIKKNKGLKRLKGKLIIISSIEFSIITIYSLATGLKLIPILLCLGFIVLLIIAASIAAVIAKSKNKKTNGDDKQEGKELKPDPIVKLLTLEISSTDTINKRVEVLDYNVALDELKALINRLEYFNKTNNRIIIYNTDNVNCIRISSLVSLDRPIKLIHINLYKLIKYYNELGPDILSGIENQARVAKRVLISLEYLEELAINEALTADGEKIIRRLFKLMNEINNEPNRAIGIIGYSGKLKLED